MTLYERAFFPETTIDAPTQTHIWTVPEYKTFADKQLFIERLFAKDLLILGIDDDTAMTRDIRIHVRRGVDPLLVQQWIQAALDESGGLIDDDAACIIFATAEP